MNTENKNQDPETYSIIGAAIEVHQQLGRGFLEAVYQSALAVEFEQRGIPFVREAILKINYKGKIIDCSYKADFVCFNSIIVELKAIEKLTNIESAQVLNYMRATKFKKGLLLNFNSDLLEKKRFVF